MENKKSPFEKYAIELAEITRNGASESDIIAVLEKFASEIQAQAWVEAINSFHEEINYRGGFKQ